MHTKTPLPWTVDGNRIIDANTEWICKIGIARLRSFEAEDELAAEIAKRVNAFPALVEALADVLRRINDSEEWWMDSPHKGGFDADAIRRALASANPTTL